jgi:two-component system OmpR family sensor kinase
VIRTRRRPPWSRRRPWAAGWPRWSLRWSLVGGVVALTAGALLAAGAASALALRAYLIDRVDDQLTAATALVRSRTGASGSGQEGGGVLRSVVAPTEYVVEVRRAGNVRSLPSAATRPPRPLSAAAPPAAPGQDAGPVTVDGGAGSYRVVTIGLRNGSVVVGRSLDPVDDTVRRLVWIETAAAAAVLLVLGASVRVLVGRRLRPLSDITDTATAIAAGDLERRVEIAPPPGRPAGTEVGRLSSAVAGMLERIQAALRARARSEERMRQFVADASHELRTPLTSIRGYAQLLRDGVLDAGERPDVLRRMDDEAARMGRLVDDLLDLARLDAGEGDGPDARGGEAARRAPVDLAAVARDCVADARAAEPGRTISLDAPPSCPVTGDEAILRQALGNLLANVRDHTPVAAGAAVTVRHEGARAVVTVSDGGPGIPAELRGRVFDRFVRLDPARGSGGTGLGLAIVKRIAESHGGTLTVDSSSHGATFTVRVPRG